MGKVDAAVEDYSRLTHSVALLTPPLRILPCSTAAVAARTLIDLGVCQHGFQVVVVVVVVALAGVAAATEQLNTAAVVTPEFGILDAEPHPDSALAAAPDWKEMQYAETRPCLPPVVVVEMMMMMMMIPRQSAHPVDP